MQTSIAPDTTSINQMLFEKTVQTLPPLTEETLAFAKSIFNSLDGTTLKKTAASLWISSFQAQKQGTLTKLTFKSICDSCKCEPTSLLRYMETFCSQFVDVNFVKRTLNHFEAVYQLYSSKQVQDFFVPTWYLFLLVKSLMPLDILDASALEKNFSCCQKFIKEKVGLAVDPLPIEVLEWEEKMVLPRLKILEERLNLLADGSFQETLITKSSTVYEYHLVHHIEEWDFRISPDPKWNQSLEKFFLACKKNPQEMIMKLIADASNRVPSSHTSLIEPAVSLNFETMFNMLLLESERLKKNDFTCWLFDQRFHKSLFALCFELLAFEKSIPFTPQNLLEIFNVTPFDICILLESFIRHQELSNQSLLHFKSMEEIMLESFIWSKNSHLYELMENEQRNKNLPSSPRKALVALSESSSTAVNQAELIYRKLFRLAFTRITFLSHKLGIQDQYRKQIWNIFTHIVENEYQMRLLCDRHIDQVLLCVIYVVCKVMDQDHSFKELISATSSDPDIFRKVLISNGEYNDIVTFYNQIFLDKTRDLVYSLKEDAAKRKVSVVESPLPEKKKTQGRRLSSVVQLSPMNFRTRQAQLNSNLFNNPPSSPTKPSSRKLNF